MSAVQLETHAPLLELKWGDSSPEAEAGKRLILKVNALACEKVSKLSTQEARTLALDCLEGTSPATSPCDIGNLSRKFLAMPNDTALFLLQRFCECLPAGMLSELLNTLNTDILGQVMHLDASACRRGPDILKPFLKDLAKIERQKPLGMLNVTKKIAQRRESLFLGWPEQEAQWGKEYLDIRTQVLQGRIKYAALATNCRVEIDNYKYNCEKIKQAGTDKERFDVVNRIERILDIYLDGYRSGIRDKPILTRQQVKELKEVLGQPTTPEEKSNECERLINKFIEQIDSKLQMTSRRLPLYTSGRIELHSRALKWLKAMEKAVSALLAESPAAGEIEEEVTENWDNTWNIREAELLGLGQQEFTKLVQKQLKECQELERILELNIRRLRLDNKVSGFSLKLLVYCCLHPEQITLQTLKAIDVGRLYNLLNDLAEVMQLRKKLNEYLKGILSPAHPQLKNELDAQENTVADTGSVEIMRN